MFGAFVSLIVALIVGLYGIKKFSILINYEDTMFNLFTVRNGLSEEIFEQDQLQFNIAFTVFEWPYDEELGFTFTNENQEQYIEYYVSLYTLNGVEYEDYEDLPIHKCNETDKSILSENKDNIDAAAYERQW